jgi:hypothetical protein
MSVRASCGWNIHSDSAGMTFSISCYRPLIDCYLPWLTLSPMLPARYPRMSPSCYSLCAPRRNPPISVVPHLLHFKLSCLENIHTHPDLPPSDVPKTHLQSLVTQITVSPGLTLVQTQNCVQGPSHCFCSLHIWCPL